MIRTRRSEMPRWEASGDGRVIGWVKAHWIGHASATFYKAYGIDPSGEVVNLENSTDRDERVRVVVGFNEDPEPWRGMHWHLRYGNVESRVVPPASSRGSALAARFAP